MSKFITQEEFNKIKLNKIKDKKIVLCHGVFDLLHIGHIIHFQEAKKLGDILVVSITSEEFVRKGPNRPMFNNELRIKFLTSIECIDYVLLSKGYTAEDVIKCVKPDFYVKGKEYEKNDEDVTGKIYEEIELVEKFGGAIKYTCGDVFSSTKLINNNFNSLSAELKEYIKSFKSKFSIDDVTRCIDKMKSLKVLVVGDIIVDEYIFCAVQGIMSKDIGYSTRYLKGEKYLGGSFAIASHISEFSENTTLFSILGDDDIKNLVIKNAKFNLDIKYDKDYETIFKTRYILENENREELKKLFAITNLKEYNIIKSHIMNNLKAKLKSIIKKFDLVVLCDFGHGLIDKEVIGIVEENSKILSINCQTNSSNYGRNLITKYKKANSFVLDQKELELAIPSYEKDEMNSLKKLSKLLNSNGFLTRGAKGAFLIKNDKIYNCPAFILKVKDTIGAGDAFFALTSLCTGVGAEEEIGLFLGSISAALATNIYGNKNYIEKVNILKYMSTLLNI